MRLVWRCGAGLQPCNGHARCQLLHVLPGRVSRLPDFHYTGLHRYHVRIATWDRVAHFTEAATILPVRDQLLQLAPRHDFEVSAYCFMPDHVHVLVEGLSEGAVLTTFVARWKQRTGYRFARAAREAGRQPVRLWQPTYFDRVLRNDEATRAVALYIIANPVRAGLAASVQEYPHVWCRWSADEM